MGKKIHGIRQRKIEKKRKEKIRLNHKRFTRPRKKTRPQKRTTLRT